MKDSKAIGINGIPAEMWKIFCCTGWGRGGGSNFSEAV
jgi:hypothetical protein